MKDIDGFEFVLFGDFYQLPSVEANHYDVLTVSIFWNMWWTNARINMLLQAKNDVNFAEFIADLRSKPKLIRTVWGI